MNLQTSVVLWRCSTADRFNETLGDDDTVDVAEILLRHTDRCIRGEHHSVPLIILARWLPYLARSNDNMESLSSRRWVVAAIVGCGDSSPFGPIDPNIWVSARVCFSGISESACVCRPLCLAVRRIGARPAAVVGIGSVSCVAAREVGGGAACIE